jgi:hypothetical protein
MGCNSILCPHTLLGKEQKDPSDRLAKHPVSCEVVIKIFVPHFLATGEITGKPF